MSIEGEIVEDLVVDQDEPKAHNPTNPITDPKPEEPEASKPEVKTEPDEPPIPKGVQKRIDRAVRQKYEAEARTKMLEERLAALENRAAAPAQQKELDNGEPKIENFDSFDAFVAAKAEWIAGRKIEQTLSEREKRQLAEREAAARKQTADSWTKRLHAATESIPDFEEVLASSDVPMSEPMQQTIMDSEIGPRIAYWLAQNPEEATRIYEMPPIRAIAAIGRLEERLENQGTEKKPTSAPAPIKPVGAKATVKKDPGQMSDVEYAKWRKSGKAA